MLEKTYFRFQIDTISIPCISIWVQWVHTHMDSFGTVLYYAQTAPKQFVIALNVCICAFKILMQALIFNHDFGVVAGLNMIY